MLRAGACCRTPTRSAGVSEAVKRCRGDPRQPKTAQHTHALRMASIAHTQPRHRESKYMLSYAAATVVATSTPAQHQQSPAPRHTTPSHHTSTRETLQHHNRCEFRCHTSDSITRPHMIATAKPTYKQLKTGYCTPMVAKTGKEIEKAPTHDACTSQPISSLPATSHTAFKECTQ